jgi:hypothetical protein
VTSRVRLAINRNKASGGNACDQGKGRSDNGIGTSTTSMAQTKAEALYNCVIIGGSQKNCVENGFIVVEIHN